MANVMQQGREAFDVGALTNAAAGERVVIFVNGNFKSQWRDCHGIQSHEYLT